MARMAALGPSRFAVLYHQFFQTSPMADIIARRIHAACLRLVSTDDTLKSIAVQCGFTNVCYFSRLFRKRIGDTPGAYRRDPVNYHRNR